MVHSFRIEAAGGGDGVSLHVTAAGHGGRGGRDGSDSAREHAVEVRGGRDDGIACRGDGEARKEVLSVGGPAWRDVCARSIGGAAGCWRTAEDSFAEDVNELVEVTKTSFGEALVSLADEEVDVLFMLNDERLNVGIVEDFGTLCLGKDEIREGDEADPGVEGEPADDEDGP